MSLRASFYRLRRERLPIWKGRLTLPRCAVCDSRVRRFRHSVTDRLPFGFYSCANCSYIFVHPKPDPKDVYEQVASPAITDEIGAWNPPFLDAIERHAHRGRLLEIGFGDAAFLRVAQERGWQVTGLEMSRPLVERAGRFGINAVQGTLADFPAQSFEVVCAFNFLEHVTDPRATLVEIKRLLTPAGIFAVLCPNIEGLYHRFANIFFTRHDPFNLTWLPPFHLSYFNKANLRTLLERSGYRIISDESHVTPLLWKQHKLSVDGRLMKLREEIASSTEDDRLAAFWPALLSLLGEKLAGALVSEVETLEPLLRAENAVFYLAGDGFFY